MAAEKQMQQKKQLPEKKQQENGYGKILRNEMAAEKRLQQKQLQKKTTTKNGKRK